MNQKSTSGRGRSGSKVSEVDMLDREAKEMEKNLKSLQERMQKQSMEDEAAPKFGGSRWKSARPDKGSVTAYAKDVQDKHRRKLSSGENPNLKSQTAPRPSMEKEKAPIDFRCKDVEFWTVADVFEWLISAQLGEYSASFRANEIDGVLLLDITLDDLDYMGVTKLGHRKTILKSIEDLRKNKRITLNLIASHEGNKMATTAPAQSIRGLISTETETASNAKETVHWSHLEPLSTNQVSAAPSSSGINAADDDFFDEAAERAAFQEAVAGWRGSGGTVKIVRESDEPQVDRKVAVTADSGMWCNPFQPMSDDLDDDSGRSSLAHTGKADAGAMTEPEEKGSPGRKPDPYINASSVGGTSLNQGMLDEAAEHQEFVKAVDAWRNRGATLTPDSATGTGTGTGTGTMPPKGVTGGASASALAMAAKIASELEDEQHKFKRRMIEQREALQASMKANEEMKKKMQAEAKCEEKSPDSRDGSGKHTPTAREHNERKAAEIEDDYKEEEFRLSVPKEGGSRPIQGRAEVSLKGSTMGLPDQKTQLSDEAAYIVDEGSDEDD